MLSALLDTNVLWPSLQRDFLLSLASQGLYRPLWSEAILEELELHNTNKLLARGSTREDAEAATAHLLGQMKAAFDDSLVTGWEALEGTFGLPDSDDEHVLASAVVGGAGVIVTDNIKHFPADMLPESLEIQSGREFAESVVSADPARAARAFKGMVHRFKNPPQEAGAVLVKLSDRYGMSGVHEQLLPLL